MEMYRKWSFRVQLVSNGIAGLVNLYAGSMALHQSNYALAGASTLMFVACTVTAWFVVTTEERHRVAQQTRESYLREQLADTGMKEEMLEHFKKMRESGHTIEFGLPIPARPQQRH